MLKKINQKVEGPINQARHLPWVSLDGDITKMNSQILSAKFNLVSSRLLTPRPCFPINRFMINTQRNTSIQCTFELVFKN